MSIIRCRRPSLSKTPSLTILKLRISAPSSKILTDVGGMEPGESRISRMKVLGHSATIVLAWEDAPNVRVVTAGPSEENNFVGVLVKHWGDEGDVGKMAGHYKRIRMVGSIELQHMNDSPSASSR